MVELLQRPRSLGHILQPLWVEPACEEAEAEGCEVNESSVQPISVGLTPERPNSGNPIRRPRPIEDRIAWHERCHGEGRCSLPTEHNLVAEIVRLRRA